jgi:crotonobetainyl-CoA:carnitine CoA-transferase CaiB-like acyl-CoA transferase
MRLPNKTSFSARREFMGAPKLGQHSVEVLRDAGLSESEIQALTANGGVIDGRIAQ